MQPNFFQIHSIYVFIFVHPLQEVQGPLCIKPCYFLDLLCLEDSVQSVQCRRIASIVYLQCWESQCLKFCSLCFSLPRDQDCHELWSKRRKKGRREAKKQEQLQGNPSRDLSKVVDQRCIPASVEPPPTAAKFSRVDEGDSSGGSIKGLHRSESSASLTSKSGVGLFASTKDVDSIPGLDLGNGSEEQGNGNVSNSGSCGGRPSGPKGTGPQNLSGIQKQLLELAQLLQEKHGRMSTAQLANALNVPLDASTGRLLENLNVQLTMAVSRDSEKRDSPDNPTHVNVGMTHPDSNVGLGPGLGPGPGPHSKPGLSGAYSGGYEGKRKTTEVPSFPGEFDSRKPNQDPGFQHQVDSGGGSSVKSGRVAEEKGGPGSGDGNAGVKAALAKLLAQQGIRVSGSMLKGGTRAPLGTTTTSTTIGDGAVHFGPSGEAPYRSERDRSRYGGSSGRYDREPPSHSDAHGLRDSFETARSDKAPQTGRQYSQQSNYNATAMSISEESNSSFSYDEGGPGEGYQGSQDYEQSRGRNRDLLIERSGEQLSVKAKVQNYLKYGNEESVSHRGRPPTSNRTRPLTPEGPCPPSRPGQGGLHGAMKNSGYASSGGYSGPRHGHDWN